MKLGYACVSTTDQNHALQIDALKAAGCERFLVDEGVSGLATDRPALFKALASLKPGDTFTVWKLDRLGRSVAQVIDILDDLRSRLIIFQSISEAIDSTSPNGQAVWQFVAVMAELERGLMLERTKAGLDPARERTVTFGRPRLLDVRQVRHARTLLAARESPDNVAATLGVSRATLYRALAEDRAKTDPMGTICFPVRSD